VVLQGQIKLSNSFAVVPLIGVELPYEVYAGGAMRYFITKQFYAQAGGFYHLAGDGLDDSGPGGTGNIGMQLYTSKNQFIDINLHADTFYIDRNTNELVGLRITYNFILPKLPPQGRRPPLPGLPF
jgi:hypothetical protein